MFRTPEEIQIARLRYIEGYTQDRIATAVGYTQARVSQILSTFKTCFRQLGIDPADADLVRDAVLAILRRTDARAA